MTHCPCCGEKVHTVEQNFCEKCGAKLEFNTVDSLNYIDSSKNKLCDLNQKFYVLREDYWKTGSCYLFNAQNQIIGIIDGRKKRNIELKENDESLIATVHFKSGSLKGSTELRDDKDKLLANLKKKRISDFNSEYYLEDPKGVKWYKAEGEFINFKFKIVDLSIKKIVAECNKTEEWQNEFPKGIFDHKHTYALKILDNSTDRRIILLFLIGIRQIRYYRMF